MVALIILLLTILNVGMRGLFKHGFPCVTITVIGNHYIETPIQVVLDTGYNGYLTLPYTDAFPMGLTLNGVGSGKVADGSFAPFLQCSGSILYGEKRVRSSIDVQPGGRPLMGMALLKDLGFKVTIDPVKETVTFAHTK